MLTFTKVLMAVCWLAVGMITIAVVLILSPLIGLALALTSSNMDRPPKPC